MSECEGGRREMSEGEGGRREMSGCEGGRREMSEGEGGRHEVVHITMGYTTPPIPSPLHLPTHSQPHLPPSHTVAGLNPEEGE